MQKVNSLRVIKERTYLGKFFLRLERNGNGIYGNN